MCSTEEVNFSVHSSHKARPQKTLMVFFCIEKNILPNIQQHCVLQMKDNHTSFNNMKVSEWVKYSFENDFNVQYINIGLIEALQEM